MANEASQGLSESQSMAEQPAAIDLILGNELDAYAVIVTRSTPESIAETIEQVAPAMVPEVARSFGYACILALKGARKLVEDFIRSQDALLIMIRLNFSMGNHTNISQLSLAGHCIVAATAATNNAAILAFRARIKGNSIWETNLNEARVSPEQRRIFEERAASCTLDRARNAGIRIITALSARMQAAPGAHNPPPLPGAGDQSQQALGTDQRNEEEMRDSLNVSLSGTKRTTTEKKDSVAARTRFCCFW